MSSRLLSFVRLAQQSITMRHIPLPRAAVGLLVACVAIAGLSGCMTTTADGRVGGGLSLDDRASGGYVTPIDVVTGRYEVTLQDYIWGAPPADGVFDITKTSLTTLTILTRDDALWNCDYDEELASATCTAAADTEKEMPMQVDWSTQDDKRHQISGFVTVTLEGETHEAMTFEGTRIVE